MLTKSVSIFAGAVSAMDWPELLPYKPVASGDQVVVCGNARFTVLTPRVIRMEWSASQSFENRATTAILNRALPPAKFSNVTDGKELTIETESLRLTYSLGSAFSADSLAVAGKDEKSKFDSWKFGQANSGNLLGTIRTLDGLGPISLNCTENADVGDLHCAWGLASRDGWAVVDDAATWALDSNGWWLEPNRNDVDLYLFAHGHDYKAALSDYVSLSGKPAMPPRVATGVWFTRWFNFNSVDVKKIVEDYKSRSLPLDIFVLDMNWHAKYAWGGYSWDRRIIPDPQDLLLDYLKGVEGLTTMVNVHDADGVDTFEDRHDEMAAAMGLDPSCGKLEFEFCSNQSYTRALEDVVVKGLHEDGVDHLWIDWQQGSQQGGCVGGVQNPTIWTNKIRVTDPLRWNDDKRGMVLARWGGMGSHRYPVGFSGDVAGLTWENMAYQPYFSFTSSNVAFGLWSHDITGPHDDYELYVRWMQWAAYSGVLRSHDRGESAGGCDKTFPRIEGPTGSDACSIVKPWNVPMEYFEANRKAIRARAALVPYTYNAVRQLYDSGVGPLRPMYYEYPEFEMAYKGAGDGSFAQYFFGDDLLVAPVVTPSATESGTSSADLAAKKVWIPPGTFVEQDTGALRTGATSGDTVLDGRYPLEEVPVFVRAGAIIPSRRLPRDGITGLAASSYDVLEFSVFPGAQTGKTSLYEDDGESTAYLNGSFAHLTASFKVDQNVLSFELVSSGSFAGQPQQRQVTLRFVNAPPAQLVQVGELELKRKRYGGAGSWSYDGNSATLVVELGELPLSEQSPIQVAVRFDESVAQMWQDGSLAGLRGAISHANLAKQRLDEVRQTPGSHEPDTQRGELDLLSVLGEKLSVAKLPDWKPLALNVSTQLAAALAEIQALNATEIGERRVAHVVALLETSQAGLLPDASATLLV